MDRNYDAALKGVLSHEGGYTYEKTDPGGPTNFGITIYDARMYLNHDLSAAPPWTSADFAFMRGMHLNQAKEIYRSKYWLKVRADFLPDGLDYTVFDFGVNSGVVRSAKYLQGLLGTVIDGIIGPKTVTAAVGRPDLENIITVFNDRRLAYLKQLPHWKTYGRGWSRRVAEVKAASLIMAKQKV